MTNAYVLVALLNCWQGESTRSQDPRAFEPNRAAVGPLQITRVLAADVGMLDYYPARFNADRDPRLATSCNREAFYRAAAILEQRLGHAPTVREIQLAWRYGLAKCKRQGWSDPEGYLSKCEGKP